MIPSNLQTLFWDTNLDNFKPQDYPDYTILRVLEYGDEPAVAWLRQTFPESEIRRVLRTERRLSRKSANFWALIFQVPSREVAALNLGR
jgi:alpha-mannosidase